MLHVKANVFEFVQPGVGYVWVDKCALVNLSTVLGNNYSSLAIIKVPLK